MNMLLQILALHAKVVDLNYSGHMMTEYCILLNSIFHCGQQFYPMHPTLIIGLPNFLLLLLALAILTQTCLFG